MRVRDSKRSDLEHASGVPRAMRGLVSMFTIFLRPRFHENIRALYWIHIDWVDGMALAAKGLCGEIPFKPYTNAFEES